MGTLIHLQKGTSRRDKSFRFPLCLLLFCFLIVTEIITAKETELIERCLKVLESIRGPRQETIVISASQLMDLGLSVVTVSPSADSPSARGWLDLTIPDDLYIPKVIEALRLNRYTLLEESFARGGEAQTVWALNPAGLPVFIKIPKTHWRPIQAILDEARNLGLVYRWAHLRGKANLFCEPRLLKLGEDPFPLRALETPMVPNSSNPNNAESLKPVKTLAERLDHNGLTDGMAVRVITQMVAALKLIHSAPYRDASTGRRYRGMIHHDIKPQNIFVDEEGNIKLADWGASWPAGGLARSSHWGLLGTRDYASENAKRGGRYDESDDIEAAQKVFYEILGRRQNLSGRTFERLEGYDVNGCPITFKDYRYGPEFEGVPRRLSIAVWSKLVHETYEWETLLQSAIARQSWNGWVKEYGKRLRDSMKEGTPPRPYRAVYDLLSFKSLITEFPEGLGFPNKVRDEFIETARNMYQTTRTNKNPSLGYHGYLHYDEFFHRISELGLSALGDPP